MALPARYYTAMAAGPSAASALGALYAEGAVRRPRPPPRVQAWRAGIVGAVGAWEQEDLAMIVWLGATLVYPVRFYACPGEGLFICNKLACQPGCCARFQDVQTGCAVAAVSEEAAVHADAN